MENCHLCKREGLMDLNYLKKAVCDRCLLKMNYKRFRNYMRGNKEEIVLVKSNESTYKLMKYFFDEARIKYKESSKGNTYSFSQDEIAENLIDSIFKNKKLNKKDYILPMSQIPQAEIIKLCEILKFPISKTKNTEILSFLNKIEKRRPGVKFSLRLFSEKF